MEKLLLHAWWKRTCLDMDSIGFFPCMMELPRQNALCYAMPFTEWYLCAGGLPLLPSLLRLSKGLGESKVYPSKQLHSWPPSCGMHVCVYVSNNWAKHRGIHAYAFTGMFREYGQLYHTYIPIVCMYAHIHFIIHSECMYAHIHFIILSDR